RGPCELLRAAARNHPQPRQIGEFAANGIGYAVGEVGVRRVAQVLEREHGNAHGTSVAPERRRLAGLPGEEDAEAENEPQRERRQSERDAGASASSWRRCGERGRGRWWDCR